MLDKKSTRRLTFESPGIYCIEVQGYLEEVWRDRLAGMQIKKKNPGGKEPVTTISGYVKDQSQLIDVLNGLYELRMPLMSLELVPKEKEYLYKDKII